MVHSTNLLPEYWSIKGDTEPSELGAEHDALMRWQNHCGDLSPDRARTLIIDAMNALRARSATHSREIQPALMPITLELRRRSELLCYQDGAGELAKTEYVVRQFGGATKLHEALLRPESGSTETDALLDSIMERLSTDEVEDRIRRDLAEREMPSALY